MLKRVNVNVGDLIKIKVDSLQENYRFDSYSITNEELARIEQYNPKRPKDFDINFWNNVNTEGIEDQLCIVVDVFEGFIILMGKYFGKTSRAKKLICFSQITQQYYEVFDFEIELAV